MKLMLATLLLLFGLNAANAAPLRTEGDQEWWCEKWDGSPCAAEELADSSRFKQILVLPAGFRSDEDWLFHAELSRLARGLGQLEDAVYTRRYRDQLLFVGYWLPGGELGSPESRFGAAIAPHPIRGLALTVELDQVKSAVQEFQSLVQPLADPFAVTVLFNTLAVDATPNASPPTFLGAPYGIAKLTRGDLNGDYVPAHELGHAALNWADEYIEPGLENMSIKSLDYLTPLAVFKKGFGGWTALIANALGVYDYRISEILASSGLDNIDTTRHPSRVDTPGYTPNEYEYEGGMFFGLGTFHDRGKNLMGGDGKGDDDGFDFNHSGSQNEVLREAFETPGTAYRPNDRLRNAGPLTNWPSAWGSRTHLMLFDADKRHRFHPTRGYDVQVGWYDRDWKTCWRGIFPYPCHIDRWVTAQKRVLPEPRTLSLKASRMYGVLSLLQNALCDLGVTNYKTGDTTIELCQAPLDVLASRFLPTFEFPLPYQDVSVPASQWFTRYYWRFRTDNGTWRSGWTGWASFYRYL